jgi:CheY-like chemotaxis protein
MTAAMTASIPRKRILCVEDDKDAQALMQYMLADYGYEAVVATSVPDALKTARSGGLSLYYLIIG